MSKKNKKKGKQIQLPLSPEKYIRTKARALPIYKCLVSRGWETAKMANVVVARKHTNGNITAGLYLVDLAEQGLKDAYYKFNEIESSFFDEIDGYIEYAHMEEIPYELAHNLVYQGVEFREDIAKMKLPKEFAIAQYILEEEDEVEYMDDLPFQWFMEEFDEDYDKDLEFEEYLSEIGLSKDFHEWTREQWNTFIDDGSIFVFDIVDEMFEEIAEEKYPNYLLMADEELRRFEMIDNFEDYSRDEKEREASLEIGTVIEDGEFEPNDLVVKAVKLVNKYPWNISFYNHLAEAYRLVNDDEMYEHTLNEMVKKFPDSVLAKVSQATVPIMKRQMENFPGVFNGKESLVDLVSGENQFYVGAVGEFHSLWCLYHLDMGNIMGALVHFTIVAEVEFRFGEDANPFGPELDRVMLMTKMMEVIKWVEAKSV